MIASHIYADMYLTDLTRTSYLRGGCLIKRIKIISHRLENGAEQKVVNNFIILSRSFS